MAWKKVSFTEQFFTPKRKVISGFGLGIAVSLIVLGVLFFTDSSKSSVVETSIQGFYNVGLNSSSMSWPFSFSSRTHEVNGSVTAGNQNFLEAEDEGTVLENPHLGNFTEVKNLSFVVEEESVEQRKGKNGSLIAENSNFLSSNGKGTVLEETHLGNITEEVKGPSFLVEEERALQKNGENGSLVADNGKFSNFSGRGFEPEITHLRNSSEVSNLKDGSLHAEETVGRSFAKNSSNVDAKIRKRKKKKKKRVRNTADQSNSRMKNETIDDESQLREMQSDSYQKCDIFYGKWVRDGSKPYYPRGSCPHIDTDFDCHLNGRPDNAFLEWKWQPNECGIPSLNAINFLGRLRGKRLVFVGDSLNRNMWESLVCILRHSIRNKKRVHEISGKTEFKKKGFYAFRFEDYNCSVDFVASPFLVQESSFTGRNGSFETLRLDLMDRTTSMYHDADIIVFNTGHWWTHEKTSKGEDYYQEGNYVHPRLKVLEAYKRALTTWARWVDKNIDVNRTQVFFRGYSVTHFSGGQWNSGGQCHKETEPIFNETFLEKYPSKMRVLERVLEGMKTPVAYLNISRLTDYRKDGHPSIYRMKYSSVEEQIAAEQSQDCSHWCLPGVPDTWNELLYASLLKAGWGSRRN